MASPQIVIAVINSEGRVQAVGPDNPIPVEEVE